MSKFDPKRLVEVDTSDLDTSEYALDDPRLADQGPEPTEQEADRA